MLRITTILSLSVAYALFASVTYAEDGATFQHVIPTDSVQFVRAFSSDSRVGVLIFDNLLVDTPIGRVSLPSVRTKAFSYVLQPESGKDVYVTQMIRGYVNEQGSGKATLVIVAGGKATTVDWEEAIAAAKVGSNPTDADLTKHARELAQQQGFTEERPDRSDDFFVAIKTPVAAGKPLQTSILLIVDRLADDDGSGAAIAVDSIDFTATAMAATEKK